MKIKKFIFITISEFSQRDYDRFGVEILINNGFKVEVFDISYLIYKVKGTSVNKVKVSSLLSYKELEEKLLQNNLSETVFIELYGESSQLFMVESLLTRLKAKTLLFNTNSIPVSVKGQSLLYKIRFLLTSFISYKRTFEQITYRLKKDKLKNHDFILIGGNKGRNCSRVGDDTEFIYGHTLDYDIYLNEQNKEQLLNYKYAVFLDEYLPYHPDEEMSGASKYLQEISDIYYKKINLFFDFLEEKHNLKIVIASHPRSNYVDNGNVFKGRKHIKGKTNLLIRDAEFCIAHFSTSINFAVLHKKPIYFISLKEIDYLFSDFIEMFAKELGNVKILIDDDSSLNNSFLKINEELYKAYMKNYIKNTDLSDNNSYNWDIVAKYFLDKQKGE